MSKRREFRPGAWERLEEREMLSHSGSPFGPASLLHNLKSIFHIGSSSVHKPPALTVGAMGDSYTDEYRFFPPDQSQARNWLEILASTRKQLGFGRFTTGSRGEPRDQGFAFNWARWGATSSDMVKNQLPGLTAQVAKGQVKFVWIFVGGDDFLDLLRNVQTGRLSPTEALTELGQVEAKAEANFKTAVNTILAAHPKVRLVVSTVPDVNTLPLVRAGLAANPMGQALGQATSLAMAEYNAAIKTAVAGNPRIALVDLASQSAQLSQAQTQTGSVPFGGTTIDLTTPGDDFHHFFLADGIHIGTVAQGIIANDFINAMNARFGTKITPLTPTQIVSFASRVRPSTP